VVLAAVVLLAMPLRALGAVTVAGQPTPAGTPAGLAPGSVYVVQPGDTLRSIASQVNPSELGVIEHKLATSIGSTHVVAGEHVTIP
jgi:LysM repeat protein